MDEDRAQSYVTRYPEGGSVVAHYDRRRPEASMLEPGVNAWLLVGVAVNGLILLLVAYQIWSR